MARSTFYSRNLQLCGSLTVTFPNDSVSRSKRPLPDGDQALQLDSKRQCWDGFCGSPPPSQKAAPQPALLSSSPSGRAAPQAYALTASRYWDDSDLDAALLEPSDGEEPDSPCGLSPEAEAKLLEDEPWDEVDPFPPFGIKAKQLEGSCLPTPSETVPPQSVSGALEKAMGAEPLLPTGSSAPCSCGLVSRNGFVAPWCGSHVPGGPPNLSSPAFPEAAASVNPEKEGENLASPGKEAAQARRATTGVGGPTVGESTSLMAKASTKEQASVVQELAGDTTVCLQGESEGGLDSANLPGEAAASYPGSTGKQSKDCVENPRTKWPKRPRQQIHICQADLERSMKSYIDTVLAHVYKSSVVGPINELHALMQMVSSERHSQGHAFRHPADLTMRNYAERANRPAQRCTLNQWVARNQRDRSPFADIPDRFERSPVPSL